MTWNIHKGIGGVDRRYDLGRTIGVLQHYEPDIVLLQEVAHDMPTLRSHDQARLLGEALGLEHSAFHREHQFKIGGYGNHILSRYPLHDIEHFDLTVGWRKRRGCLQARAYVPVNGHHRTLVIQNLHLGLAGSERAQQLGRLLDKPELGQIRQRTPLLLGGDLNDLWGSLGRRFLLPLGFSRVDRREPTFPAALPLRPLDALFVRGDVRVVKGYVGRTELARNASDHLPVVGELDLFAPFG